MRNIVYERRKEVEEPTTKKQITKSKKQITKTKKQETMEERE